MQLIRWKVQQAPDYVAGVASNQNPPIRYVRCGAAVIAGAHIALHYVINNIYAIKMYLCMLYVYIGMIWNVKYYA